MAASNKALRKKERRPYVVGKVVASHAYIISNYKNLNHKVLKCNANTK